MPSDESKKIFPTLIDHAWNPRNLGPLEIHNGHARIKGPCGDTMEFWVRVENGKIKEVSFTTDGCASSLACGSMATCLAEGRTTDDALKLQPKEIIDALEDLPPESEHCAVLAAHTLRAACEDLLRRNRGSHV